MQANLEANQLKSDVRALLASEVKGTSAMPFRVVDGNVNGGPFQLTVWLSCRFLRAVRKERLVNHPVLYSALANLKYGYDPAHGASPGGKDGIFSVSPDYRPKNEMVAKLYDRCLHTGRGLKELGRYLAKTSEAQGVRIVCHGLRLLGFIEVQDDGKMLTERLVLIDLDLNKR